MKTKKVSFIPKAPKAKPQPRHYDNGNLINNMVGLAIGLTVVGAAAKMLNPSN